MPPKNNKRNCRHHEGKGSRSKRSRPERSAPSTDDQASQEPGPSRSRECAIAIESEDVATVNQSLPPTPVPALAIQSVVPLQEVGTRGTHQTRPNSIRISQHDLQIQMNKLLDASISSNTTTSYETGLRSFFNFRREFGYEILWPPPLRDVVQFVSYLSLKKCSYATARSYLSSISFQCKVQNLVDETKNFLVLKVLEGMRRIGRSADARLPITLELLKQLVETLPEVPEVTVWCVGSSIIKNAMMASVCRPGGSNLGLDRLNMNIWWQGYSGLKFLELKRKLFFLTQYEESPDYLIIHCGVNDIGAIDLFSLIQKIKTHLQFIKVQFPQSTLVWSQMLPRIKWRYSNDNKAMERCRLKANRVAASSVLKLGGCYIKHPDLLRNMSQFLMPDGVHLNELGNKLFLNNFQGGLEFFQSQLGQVYP
ncbi:uncharacterized protein LOC128175395 isoform X2 [Crassostrea angulata]|uniref:uncharacterized protein LOC128175395 isoform X2 n=1 Tax=Magallana angulata TaxID=2784310 RepID=UPI0022B1FAC7|nr:uncharacterized protein LOC128175395 isoform X2 [Crassostrea angulata]